MLTNAAAAATRCEPELASMLGPEHWLDPSQDDRRRKIAAHIWQQRRQRNLTQGQSHVLAGEPLPAAAALIALGEADILVTGATCPTAEVARAALRWLGAATAGSLVSGACLLVPPGPAHRCLMLADVAVVPDPDANQLVQIARSTARSYRRLWLREPTVAMLSFSTRGSADHPSARRIARATQDLSGLPGELKVMGEIQADAALDPEVARSKGLPQTAADQADVLVFPDLDSANIGQKLVVELGEWRAVGPLLQGLQRPVCGLSQNCTALDIVDAAVLATLTAE
jgi:phosphotransacetylase